jgi:DNA invertase Pin-like site-specific DNA recombinase
MTENGKTQTIGYIRVSTVEQKTERQLHGFTCDKIFIDHVSGKTIERPALKEMLSYARNGDTVLIHSMDRLARNTEDLLHLVGFLTRANITVRFIFENLTFNGALNPMSQLMLTIMGAVAQFELALLNERRREGIARAHAAGKYKGRAKKALKLTEIQIVYLADCLKKGVPKTRIAKELGITKRSIYNYMHLLP